MGRVKKDPKPIQKECEFCGGMFTAFSRQTKYCPECRDPASRECAAVKKGNPNKALFALLRKIDKYNGKHGTYLSYGKYVSMMGGKSKNEINT